MTTTTALIAAPAAAAPVEAQTTVVAPDLAAAFAGTLGLAMGADETSSQASADVEAPLAGVAVADGEVPEAAETTVDAPLANSEVTTPVPGTAVQTPLPPVTSAGEPSDEDPAEVVAGSVVAQHLSAENALTDVAKPNRESPVRPDDAGHGLPVSASAGRPDRVGPSRTPQASAAAAHALAGTPAVERSASGVPAAIVAAAASGLVQTPPLTGHVPEAPVSDAGVTDASPVPTSDASAPVAAAASPEISAPALEPAETTPVVAPAATTSVELPVAADGPDGIANVEGAEPAVAPSSPAAVPTGDDAVAAAQVHGAVTPSSPQTTSTSAQPAPAAIASAPAPQAQPAAPTVHDGAVPAAEAPAAPGVPLDAPVAAAPASAPVAAPVAAPVDAAVPTREPQGPRSVEAIVPDGGTVSATDATLTTAASSQRSDVAVAATAPADIARTAGTVSPRTVDRVLDAVRALESGPPPRRLTLELPELDGLRVHLAVRGGRVHVEVDPPAHLDQTWRDLRHDLSSSLARRGFDLAGNAADGRAAQQREQQRSGSGQRPTGQPAPSRRHRDPSELRL